MLADGGAPALLLSRSSFDVAMEVEVGQSAPVPLSPNCFPRGQSDPRIPHQTTGAIGCLILCAHGINSMRCWARTVPMNGASSQRVSMDTRSKRVRFGRQGASSSCVLQKSSLDVSPARSPAPAPRSLLTFDFEATEGQDFGEHASWTWGVQPHP